MKKRGHIKLLIGAALTVAVVWFSFRALGGFDISSLFHSAVDWKLAAVSALIFAFSNVVRAPSYTLGIDRKLKFSQSLRIIAVAGAANMLLPLRAGEGIRLALFPHGYSPAKRTRLAVAPGLADVLSILLLSLLAVQFAGIRSARLLHTLHLIVDVCVAAALLCAALVLGLPWLRRKARRYLRLPVLRMTIWVFLSWVTMLFSIWVGLLAFGYGAVQAVKLSLSVFAATNIMMFIPSSPGGIGLFEYGVVLGIGAAGIPEAAGKTVGLLLHLIQYAGALPLGAVMYFWGKRAQRASEAKRKAD